MFVILNEFAFVFSKHFIYLWKSWTIRCFEWPALFDQVLRKFADAARNWCLLSDSNVERTYVRTLSISQDHEHDNSKCAKFNFLVVIFSSLHKPWCHVIYCASHLCTTRVKVHKQKSLNLAWFSSSSKMCSSFMSRWMIPAEWTDSIAELASVITCTRSVSWKRVRWIAKAESKCVDNARVIKIVDDFILLKKSFKMVKFNSNFIVCFIVTPRFPSFVDKKVYFKLLQSQSLFSINFEYFWSRSRCNFRTFSSESIVETSMISMPIFFFLFSSCLHLVHSSFY